MGRFTVTDVVDMDVALHGRRFIVIEFALVTAVAAAIAVVSSVEWARVYAAFIAVNCATFMVLAAVRPRRQAPELKGVYLLTAYAMLLLFVPLYFPIAAVFTGARERAELRRART